MMKVNMSINQFMKVQRGEMSYKDLKKKTSFDPASLCFLLMLPKVYDVIDVYYGPVVSDLVQRGLSPYHGVYKVCEYVHTLGF
jgi:hypothetical protein